MRRQWTSWGLGALVAVLALVLYVPAVLAFPHNQRFGQTTVYSVDPIAPQMGAILTHADALTATSPLNHGPFARSIFLTGGGWRWSVLSIGQWSAFAQRRPLTTNLVFNRSDIAANSVTNGKVIAGRRTLSGTIAHETTHVLVVRALGEIDAKMLPTWKQEGYADYLARESSLSEADAARLRAAGQHPPALIYFDARRRVAAALRANGGSVEALLKGD